MEKQEFIDLIIPGAFKAYKEHCILPSLTLAQAVLESGWGKYSPGNMLFGIKWTEGCGYEKQLLGTKEYINGEYIEIQDYFRAYDSMADSVYDHAMFLVNNSRYAPVLQAQNYIEACTLIQQCGYATDPNYTQSLIKIIECYNFQLYDQIAKKEKQTEEVAVIPEITVEEAIQILVGNGIINSPDHWLKAIDTVKYLDQLFINMAKKLKG